MMDGAQAISELTLVQEEAKIQSYVYIKFVRVGFLFLAFYFKGIHEKNVCVVFMVFQFLLLCCKIRDLEMFMDY